MSRKGEHQWVFLASDSGGCFTSSRADVRPSIVSLSHPCTMKAASFMICGSRVLEIQKINSETPASWFVDETIHKHGCVHVASAVDPLFLVLPALASDSTKFRPLDQILSTASGDHGTRLQACLSHAQLALICDVNDRFGKDMLLYRLNEARTIAWLKVKARRLAKVFAARRWKTGNLAAKSAAFAMSSVAARSGETDDESKTGATPPDAPTCRAGLVDAVHMLAEYVSTHWRNKLTEALGLQPHDISAVAKAHKKKANQGMGASAAAAWNKAAQDDISRFQKRSGDDLDSPRASKKNRPVSRANKQLAKANIKGMKSMASFFSKKSKARTK